MHGSFTCSARRKAQGAKGSTGNANSARHPRATQQKASSRHRGKHHDSRNMVILLERALLQSLFLSYLPGEQGG
ncbi:MAG TPA: hypothetical protein VKK79_26210 [Candidatus Lokiarchaeia archaeon]|nr:hypothetical protein [Candidatus Lokiarchaeia archaeon]